MAQDRQGPQWHDTPELAQKRAAAKREMLEAALARGKTQIRLDARRPGVRVPEPYQEEPALALNLSWRFAHTDMVVNDRGVAATLRFGGVPFRCVVPWSAFWGLLAPESDAVHVWPPDLPDVLGGPPRTVDEAEPLPVEPQKPVLAVVKGEAEPAPVAAEATPVEAAADEDPNVSGVGEDAADRADDAETPSVPASQRAPWLRVVR